MNIFFDLAEVQQVALLTEWLTFIDFRKFHFAIWNKQRRAELKTLLANKQCSFVNDEMKDATWGDADSESADKLSAGMEWSIRNGVRFDDVTLDIPCKKSATCRRRLLTYLSQSLKTVVVYMNGSKVSANSASYELDLKSVLDDILELCPHTTHVKFVQAGFQPDFSSPLYMIVEDFLVKPTAFISVSFRYFKEILGSLLLAISSNSSLQRVKFCDSRCTFSREGIVFEYNTHRNKVVRLHVSTFVSVCALFPNITTLSMTDLRCKHLSLLVKYCPLVQSAVLTMSPKGGDFNAKSIDALSRWKDISKLAIRSSGISEDQLILLIRTCKTLTHICTIGSAVIESRLGDHIPKQYTGSKLMTLHTHCDSADTLIQILSLCPYLHTLSLYSSNYGRRRGWGSDSDSDSGGESTRSRSSVLTIPFQSLTPEWSVRYLKLESYQDLEDADILKLQHTRLHSLTIRESDRITNGGIQALLPTLHSLHTFALIDCLKMEHSLLLQIPKLSPSMRSLSYAKRVPCTCGERFYGCGCDGILDLERSEFLPQVLRAALPQLEDIDIDI